MTIPKILWLLSAAICCTVLTACDDSLEASFPRAEVIIDLDMTDIPDDAGSLHDAKFTFSNISNGTKSVYYADEAISLVPGLYDVAYSATCLLSNGVTATLRARQQSVTISQGRNNLTLRPYRNIESDDLIISEIFFAGTLQTSGNQYYGDDYVKLYNNTGHVIYADGLTFFESKFLTTQKLAFTPDIMSEAMTVEALYTIPGSGTDYPVKPGEFLLLADTGIDHRAINPNSFDLSHAGFEWYDVSSSPSTMDIDSPSVPNLDKWYCYTQTVFMLHNRGFKAYGIARIPIDREKYLADYYYNYEYETVTAAGTFPMSQSAYRLPNEWITDVVNCSVQSGYQWTLCTPGLDMGWTHCGTIDKDKTRYFHSVRRKVIGFTADGNPILQDTNNSSLDFNPMVTPSEIEEQHSATDASGTPCANLTWDGVTPR